MPCNALHCSALPQPNCPWRAQGILLPRINKCCLQGRVVENGTHSSLLAKGGKYATMWSRQANVDDSSALELLEDHQHNKTE